MSEDNIRRDLMPTLAEEMVRHEHYLGRHRGRRYVGLATETLPRLDRATLGLRGLMLLVGGPNVGKTALGVQLGLDVVRNNPDACFLFVSLEMPRQSIAARILCGLGKIEWRTLISASEEDQGEDGVRTFRKGELEAIARAKTDLAEIGQRILILDDQNFPRPSVDEMVIQLEELKASSGATRGIILVDYLQVLPIPHEDSRDFGVASDAEADRWRIGAMKRLRDLTGDAVLVISEARKPAPGKGWAASMEDVEGSERNAYTPDMVFLLQTLTNDEMVRQWRGSPEQAAKEMEQMGVVFLRMAIAKGRDGVSHEILDLTYWHRQSRFAGGFRAM